MGHFPLLVLLFSLSFVINAKVIGPCQDLEDSSTCTGKAPWQSDGVCHFNRKKAINQCLTPDTKTFRFIIEASYRNSRGTSPHKQMFIRGSGPGLSWERSIEMSKSVTRANTWSITIEYKMDSLGLQCTQRSHCILNQKAVEFRLYGDQAGRIDMKGGNFYIELPVSGSLVAAADPPPVVSVYPWFSDRLYGFNVLKDINFIYEFEPFEIGPVKVRVLVPPSYTENVYKRYPLVILLDRGRSYYTVFEYLYSYTRLIEEVFVVVVDPTEVPLPPNKNALKFSHTQPYRRSTSLKCHRSNSLDCGRQCNNCWREDRVEKCDKEEFIREFDKCYWLRNVRGIGEVTLTAIVDTIVPELMAKYDDRIEFDPPLERLTLIGYSDLAVTAFVTGLSRPDIIKNVAAISPSFFTPLEKGTFKPLAEVVNRQMDYFVARARTSITIRSLYSTQKYYFSHGENERIGFPIADPLQLTETVINRMKKDLGMSEGDNLMYQIVPNTSSTYPIEYPYPLMSTLQNPMLFFHRPRGGESATRGRSIHLTEEFIASRRSVEINAFIRNNKTGSKYNASGHYVPPVNRNSNCVSYASYSMTTYMGLISISVILSVVVAAILMQLREESRLSIKQEEEDDTELLEEHSSLESVDT